MNVAKICYWTSESVDEIVDVINRSLFPKFDCEINLEKLKDRIVYTLVNADSNKSRLKTIPYRLLKGTDLAITYKLIIDIDFNATASSDVTNALMEHLGVTEMICIHLRLRILRNSMLRVSCHLRILYQR